ncbi:GAF domain-containing protein [Orenia metallireducens]|jgi:GAF domain-containing protein|uniref:GAF domain-containing protein n=1 Tax=Orenia metallireducens TaxID=1413210 RepID=A0A285GBS0_9FIRM|nr:GAF domain-containing protein [Orenia metallireducens]PRX32555.1 GAF domain-containing protein [Orenia metallireducens]SNY20858.1 GAF domain-containing protein [Orenia metallireducens]
MNKEEIYQNIILQVKGLTSAESDLMANLANISAVLYNNLEEVNWAGFYLWKEDQLVLGPFQGKSACVRIAKGKGVCGSAIEKRETLVVKDVHDFPGHIACDAASSSEVVVPIIIDNQIKGVLDIDSPIKDRFDKVDQKYLEEVVAILIRETEWKYSI